jgi:diacylglycerol kinase (ATP)
MSVTLVVNPTAGRNKAAAILPQVLKELLRGLPEGSLTVRQAASFEDASKDCHEAVEEALADPSRRSCLVVMGGDGMMHLGVNAAASTGVPLGLIPAGTGNDICRGFGIPLDPLAAARLVVAGTTTKVDLANVVGRLSHHRKQRYVGSVVATGFDARVGIRGRDMPAIFGSGAYAAAALVELSGFEPLAYRMRIDGAERNQTAMFIAVSNAGYYGGGMLIAPDWSVSDGLLDVTIIHPVSRLTLLRMLPRMFDGSFVRDPAVERLKASEVVIDGDGLIGMADGEKLGDVPLGVTCDHEALTIFAPLAHPLTNRRKANRRSR